MKKSHYFLLVEVIMIASLLSLKDKLLVFVDQHQPFNLFSTSLPLELCISVLMLAVIVFLMFLVFNISKDIDVFTAFLVTVANSTVFTLIGLVINKMYGDPLLEDSVLHLALFTVGCLATSFIIIKSHNYVMETKEGDIVH